MTLIERLLAVIALQQMRESIEYAAELSITDNEKASKRLKQINALILKLD